MEIKVTEKLKTKDIVYEETLIDIKTLLDLVIDYTEGYFKPEDDELTSDIMEERDFEAFAEASAMCFGYREPLTTAIRTYAKILRNLSNSKDFKDAEKEIIALNTLLKENECNTIFEIK